MKVEIYYFYERTLDPRCCKVEEIDMTEEEFDALDLNYNEVDDMYYSKDGRIGYYILEY